MPGSVSSTSSKLSSFLKHLRGGTALTLHGLLGPRSSGACLALGPHLLPLFLALVFQLHQCLCWSSSTRRSSYLRAFSLALSWAWNVLQLKFNGLSLVLAQMLLLSEKPSLTTLSKAAIPVPLCTFDPGLTFLQNIYYQMLYMYWFIIYLPYQNLL